MKNQIAVQLSWTLLAIFSLAAAYIAWAWRGRDSRRIWTTFWFECLILAGIWLPAYLGGGWLVAAVFALLLGTIPELHRVLEAGGERPIRWLGVALGASAVAVGALAPAAVPWLLLASLGLAAGLAALADRTGERTISRLRSTMLGVVYPGVCLAHVVALGQLEGGFGYLVLCYGLVEVNDSVAFLVGSSLGRRKIFPSLSPNKTIEGSVGGILATIVAGFVFRFAVPGFSTSELVVGAVLLAFAGQAGDLFASRIKRRADVKDFGSIVPMHGGVLDVYDSLIFCAPIFYYYVLAIAR